MPNVAASCVSATLPVWLPSFILGLIIIDHWARTSEAGWL
jgi:hypothetical protein